ncbi:MAG: N-acetylglucosamine-6-phosphate deacetylase [Aerococcaceae bacterium]|nr:N-acetylglucosamine-6-phosphate deacetylase [Aerococcaceae bacterium]
MSRLALINGQVIRNGELQQRQVIIENERIVKITPDSLDNFDGEIIDVQGKIVSPGFIDIHTHGGFNVDINHASAEDLSHLSKQFATQGTTSFLMSIVTDEDANVLNCIESYHQFKTKDLTGADIMGIHLEGPYLSQEYRGSMPEHLIVPYNHEQLTKFQEAAKGAIKYVTVAPEVEGIVEHIPDIVEKGIKVSIGHSGATYAIAKQAIEVGAQCCTHTFNAMRLFHQHEPAIMGAVLESEQCYCEAICDGRHLHPGTVRMLLQTKGWDRVVAITDSIMAAGLPDGKYKLGVNDIVVVNGDAKLAYADVRAGSTLTTGQALRNIMNYTGAPVTKVSKLLTENPAKLFDMFDEVGSIDVGKLANIVILDQDYQVVQTIVKGKSVFVS